MTSDDLRNRALRAVGWVIIEKWGVRLVSLAVFAILTRVLDSRDFGLLSLAAVFTAILGVFVDSGFSKALVQRRELAAADAPTAFWTSLGASLLLYGVLALCSPWLADLLGDTRLAPVLLVLGALLPLGALSSTPAALLERDFQFRSLSFRQLTGTIGGAAVAVPMALLGAGVWALVAQPIATAVISLVALWISTRWRPTLCFSWSSLKNLYGVSAGVLGVELLNAVQANIDKLLIGFFLGPTAVGFYYVGQKALTTLSELVTTVIARVSLTTFSRIQDDSIRLNSALQKMSFASAGLAFPAFGITALLAPQVIPGVFGTGWQPAVIIFQVLAVSAAFASVTYFDQNLLIASGKPRAAFLLALGQNILGILLMLAAVPWGTTGVAVSRSIRVLAYWPVRLLTLRTSAAILIWPYVRQVTLSLIAIIPVLVGLGLLQLTPWAQGGSLFTFAVPAGLAALVVYVCVAWMLMGQSNRKLTRDLLSPPIMRVRRHFGGKSLNREAA